MGRHLTVGTAIEVTRVSSDTPFLELLDIEVVDEAGAHVDWIRLVKNTENITYQGNLYLAASFKLDVQDGIGEEPKLTITAEDPTGIVRQAIDAYQGGTDFPVTFTVVNSARLTAAPEVQETFLVQAATTTGEWTVNFTLGMDGALSKKFPRRAQYPDRCGHIYKDGRCAYAGPLATCDYSLFGTNGCIVHANAANFGGYPGLTDR